MDSKIDLYYQKNIFPKIEAGKFRFNFIAALFGPYWFAYKGLWKEWRVYYVSLLIILVLLHYFLLNYGLFSLLFWPLLGLASFIVMLISGVYANKRYYRFFNKPHENFSPNSILRGLIAGLTYVFILLSFFYLSADYISLKNFKNASMARVLYREVQIVDQSMYPTLGRGDTIRVDMSIDRIFSGDIVLFTGVDQSVELSRVVALEGDLVVIKHSKVYINSRPLGFEVKDESFLKSMTPIDLPSDRVQYIEETNDSMTYLTLAFDKTYEFDFKVSPGHVLVIKDNRLIRNGDIKEIPIDQVVGVFIP